MTDVCVCGCVFHVCTFVHVRACVRACVPIHPVHEPVALPTLSGMHIASNFMPWSRHLRGEPVPPCLFEGFGLLLEYVHLLRVAMCRVHTDHEAVVS